ncbi:MAG: IS110 family transposase [Isosphaerales bacterium]
MSHFTKMQFVGLDVHKDSIVIAVAEEGREPARVLGTVPYEFKALSKVLKRIGPRSAIRCCYEAGPTGYGLARSLRAVGWACDVIAPSLVPKKSGERIKTDRRDAANLAQNHRSGELVPIFIPDEETEAMRDLVRAREDAKKTERVARHQLSKFLLRQGLRYAGKTTWNDAHRAWIAGQLFTEPAQQYVLADGLAAVEAATLRVQQLTDRLRQLTQGWRQEPLIKAMQALRGVEFVTAVTLAAEVGDFRRFARAGDFMGYVGLIPSEWTSGPRRRPGPITRTGNAHVRHVLVESAWHYRRQPRMSKALRERSKGVSPQVCAIAWKAQTRLHNRLQRLIGRGKNPAEAATAVARELAGFVWAICREETLLVN